jgi:hypothetical protein
MDQDNGETGGKGGQKKSGNAGPWYGSWGSELFFSRVSFLHWQFSFTIAYLCEICFVFLLLNAF